MNILQGDALEKLRELEDESVHCCVTSPPYWGLRDYGVQGQLGLEKTPEEYVARMVEVFREVRRVLRSDGTLWLNIGDTYAANRSYQVPDGKWTDVGNSKGSKASDAGCKPKDLVGIPWMLAFALRKPYVDWRIKSEAMRAWVAGIVDGEGCITILRTKSSHSDSLSFPPIVQVRMCDKEPLGRLVDVAGSSFGNPQMPPSHAAKNQRESYQWKVVSENAAQVIAEIYPFLTCKRKQAIVAWNHQMFRSSRGNQERKSGDLEKEQFCKDIINRLNQRQPADIPSWMIEPRVVETPGWYLRQDCIWSKPNPMPESVTDRCTKSHEYLFLLTKSGKYYFDNEAIKEPFATDPKENYPARAKITGRATQDAATVRGNDRDKSGGFPPAGAGRNKRSVWSVATSPFPEAHFATFPPKLIEPCVLAGCPPGGVVLDPFSGAGTTALVALRHQRNFIGIELNPEYITIARNRLLKEVLS